MNGRERTCSFQMQNMDPHLPHMVMSLTAPCISKVPLLRRSKLQHLVTRSGALRLRTCGVESHFQCKVQQRNGKVITWRPTIPTGLFFMDLAAAMPWVPSVATHPRPGPSPWDPPQIIRSKRLAGVSERGQRAHLQHVVTRRRRRGTQRLPDAHLPRAADQPRPASAAHAAARQPRAHPANTCALPPSCPAAPVRRHNGPGRG